MSLESDQYDFFVSYARKDDASGWITRFIEQLQDEHRKYSGGREFRVFLDKTGIRSLDDWRHRIYESMAASRLLVAFISPAYLASEWCRREWHAWIDVEIAKHVLSDGAAPVYIVEVPWLGKTMTEQQVAEEIARLLQRPADLALARDAVAIGDMVSQRQFTKVLPFYETGLEALRHEDLRKVLADLANNLSSRSDHVEAAALSKSTIPPYNRRFVGRLEELALLRNRLHQGRTGVISGHKGDLQQDKSIVAGVQGLGGIGKTELAFTYAHAFAGLYPGGRFLVPCDGQPVFRRAMLTLDEIFHDQIHDEQRKDPDLHFGAIRDCLRRRLREVGRILLVLDNVSDRSLLSPEQTDPIRMLGPDIHLLATTRLGAPEMGAYDDIHWLTLGELSVEDSLRLLEKFRLFETSAEQVAAKRIAQRLGGFALCVEVVGAYLGQHREQSYAGYLEKMGLADLEQVDQTAERGDVSTRRHNNEKRLGAILARTLRSLSEEEIAALKFAALLPPDHVVLPWLRPLVGAKHPELADGAEAWDRLVTRLASLALLTRGQDGDQQALDEAHHSRIVRCHRLVQEYIRGRLVADEMEGLNETLLSFINTRVQIVGKSWTDRGCRWEIAPLAALAQMELSSENAEFVSMAQAIAVPLQRLMRLDEAEALIRKATELETKHHNPMHPKVAICLNQLSAILVDLNRLEEAEQLLRRALAIFENAYGENSGEVGLLLGNLGDLLGRLNRPLDAELLLRRALRIAEEKDGSNHVSVAMHLGNLVAVLRDTNRLSEAEHLIRRALAIDETNRGRDDPMTASRVSTLSKILIQMERYAEAEPFARQALEIDEKTFEPDHPNIGNRLGGLAFILERTNRAADAEPLRRRALAIAEKSHHPKHPDVAICLGSLGVLLRILNRSSESEPLLRRALEIDEECWGPNHPRVAVDLNNLARLLQKNRNALMEAEPILRRAVEILVQFAASANGREHAHWSGTIANYVGLLTEMGLSREQIRQKLNEICRPFGCTVKF